MIVSDLSYIQIGTHKLEFVFIVSNNNQVKVVTNNKSTNYQGDNNDYFRSKLFRNL